MRGRVLFVDDDALIRKAGERAMTRAGFEVAAVSSALEARHLVDRSDFDAAILDYYLADGECGCDLIPMLRGRNTTMRIAVLSGLGVLPDLVRHALGAGADLVAPKIGIDWPALVRGESVPARPPSTVNLNAIKRDIIHGVFLVHRRNVTGTARALGMSRSSLQRMLRRTPPPILEEDE